MQITVDIHVETRLTLREFVGEGQCDGHDFDFCLTIPDHSFYITLDDTRYIVKSSDIIQAVVAAHIKVKGE